MNKNEVDGKSPMGRDFPPVYKKDDVSKAVSEMTEKYDSDPSLRETLEPFNERERAAIVTVLAPFLKEKVISGERVPEKWKLSEDSDFNHCIKATTEVCEIVRENDQEAYSQMMGVALILALRQH